jgi:ABC-2 type transport system permease protein
MTLLATELRPTSIRSRSWRVSAVGPLAEGAYRARVLITPVTLAVQLFLYDRLWTAVFAHVTGSVGLTAQQTITYALTALLLSRIRWGARSYAKDTVSIAIREGTIAYWYLRPISAARYYMWRQLGEMAYGGIWAVIGFAIGVAAGAIQSPPMSATSLWALLSVILGQAILYYLGMLLDLSTFWMIDNGALRFMYGFVQDFLSGVFVPLWFLSGARVLASGWSPFSAGINIPLSIYVGKIPQAQASGEILIQLGWLAILAIVTRLLWLAAARRVTVQGG